MAKVAVTKDSNAHLNVEQLHNPWSDALTGAQLQAKEDRDIQAMLKNAGLSYDELHESQERGRALRSLDKSTCQRDVDTMQRRLKKLKRGLLDPDGHFMQIFDVLTLLAMGFTISVTPYEIGLIHESGNALKAINHSVGVIFGIGIILQFFLPYQKPLREGGAKVFNHGHIARHYMKSWFFLDVVSTIPYDLIADMAITSQAAADSSVLGLMKLMRILRLLKLGRIFRVSRIIHRWEQTIEMYVDISNTTKTLMFWTWLVLTVIHWFCCGWCVLALLMGTQRTAELEAARMAEPSGCDEGVGSCLSQCEAQLLSELSPTRSTAHILQTETWLCRAISAGMVSAEAATSRHHEAYFFVLGADQSGPGFISPTNTNEYIVNFTFGFLMLILLNIFVGVVASVISESDPQTSAFKATMDHLNHFLREVKAPEHLCRRTRDYLRYTKELVAKQSYNKLFGCFAPRLRGDILGHISMKTLQAVPTFVDCEPEFMRQLSQELRHFGFEAGEQIVHAEPTLCIVTRGTAVRGGKPITSGQYWGEDIVVSSEKLRDHRPTSALTYAEIVCLSKSSLLSTAAKWPVSARVIRVEALRVAMIRAPQLIVHYLQRKATTSSSMHRGVAALHTALANIGPGTRVEHREYHAVLKTINGERPLRGFAREQRSSVDGRVAALASSALSVAGDEGKLLIDENGRVVGSNGGTVEVVEDKVDASVKAVAELREHVDAKFDALTVQMRRFDEVFKALAILNNQAPPRTGELQPQHVQPEHLGGGAPQPRRRRRERRAGRPSVDSSVALSPAQHVLDPAGIQDRLDA